jgi:5-methylcytosine-specific restriction endonuclease McrA
MFGIPTLGPATRSYYRTPEWRRLRQAALDRDLHTCTVPGCGDRAVVVDHIVSRTRGGADVLENLRSLCREHDNQIKEDAAGVRRRGGLTVVRGCGVDGTPLDPGHWWRS